VQDSTRFIVSSAPSRTTAFLYGLTSMVLLSVLLQAQVASLTSELHEARGAATQTPDRCRTAARELQAEADRCAAAAVASTVQQQCACMSTNGRSTWLVLASSCCTVSQPHIGNLAIQLALADASIQAHTSPWHCCCRCCRAADYARNNEARVKKLRQIVQLGVSCCCSHLAACSLTVLGAARWLTCVPHATALGQHRSCQKMYMCSATA
jgi:hypothetical protein